MDPRCSFSSSPGCSIRASRPPLVALRVVSFPAITITLKQQVIRFQEGQRLLPSIFAFPRTVLTRSSARLALALLDHVREVADSMLHARAPRSRRASRPHAGTRGRPRRWSRWSSRKSSFQFLARHAEHVTRSRQAAGPTSHLLDEVDLGLHRLRSSKARR